MTDFTDNPMELIPATQLAPGVTLHTRDGKAIGNAIVVELMGTNRKGVRLWTIETDFGNRAALDDIEIERYYSLGYISDYGRWFEDRKQLIVRRAVKMTLERIRHHMETPND